MYYMKLGLSTTNPEVLEKAKKWMEEAKYFDSTESYEGKEHSLTKN